MCTDPVLLCLDEPAAGLNPREAPSSTRCCSAIRDEHGTSILLIEHDMARGDGAFPTTSSCSITARRSPTGAPAEIRDDPEVIAAYLGVDDEAARRRSEVGVSGRDEPLLTLRGVTAYYGNIMR